MTQSVLRFERGSRPPAVECYRLARDNINQLFVRPAPREKKEPAPEAEEPVETEAQKQEQALQSALELKSIKSELNLSDHTQIIKYEPNLNHGACKVQGK